jgi:hypothetical protein
MCCDITKLSTSILTSLFLPTSVISNLWSARLAYVTQWLRSSRNKHKINSTILLSSTSNFTGKMTMTVTTTITSVTTLTMTTAAAATTTIII